MKLWSGVNLLVLLAWLDTYEASSFSWLRIPEGTKWAMTHAFTIPLASISTIQVNIPITYTFDNTSRFALTNSGRSEKSHEQMDLFNMIESTLATLGLDGKPCVLRAICEINESPMRDLTLIGEIITLVLTPRRSIQDGAFLLEYLKAEDIGRRRKGNCGHVYSCPLSIRHLLLGLQYAGR